MTADLTMFVSLQVEALCPHYGITIPNWQDKTTWIINFAPQATVAQRTAALNWIQAFDPKTADVRSNLAKAIDASLTALPSIDPRVKAVFQEWRKQIP